MGFRVLVRDHEGQVSATLSRTVEGFPESETVEAMGALCAVEFCRDLGVHDPIFEGGLLNVVKAIIGHGSRWCRYGHVVDDIQRVLRGFRS